MAPNPKDQTRKTGIEVPPRWKEKIPRFLFRGWNPSSGGNPKLNTRNAVIPHAFYGPDKEPQEKSISGIPTDKIKTEVMEHLSGGRIRSHFCSWAADFQTALDYAGVGTDAHLAVFDTSLRGKYNEIYHVPALHAIGFTPCPFAHEYLVFGPVEGEAYTCVSVAQLRKHGMNMTVRYSKSTSGVTEKDLIHIRKISNQFRPVRGVVSPDLILTVCAAELGRLFHPSRGHNYGSGWSQKDNGVILTQLSVLIENAGRRPSGTSLVNPRTYVDGFPQLKAMVDILMTVELAIDRKRSEISKNSSLTTIVSTGSGKKRKVDHNQVSTDSKVVDAEPQKALPRDLLEDLVRHGKTFQEGLQVTKEQLDSTDAKAQALKANLILTEKRLKALSMDPKRHTLNTTIHDMKNAASGLDGLTKRTQDFTAELQHVEASIGVLQKSFNEIIKSIGKEEDPFVPEDPKNSVRPLGPPKPKAVAKQDQGFQSRKKPKATKQKGKRSAEKNVLTLNDSSEDFSVDQDCTKGKDKCIFIPKINWP